VILVSYLIGNGIVLTMDRERRIIYDGAVAIEGNQIVDVGKTKELQAKYDDSRFIDASNHIIMPGLIDCHVHLAQALIRGCADDLSLIDWLSKRVWVFQGNYTEVEGKLSAELCILEMLKSGTTTFAETLLASRYGFDGIAETVLKSGIRGVLAKSVMDISTYATKKNIMYPGMIEDGAACLEEALAMHKKWNGAGDGKVFVWLGPRPVGSTSKEMLTTVGLLAKQKDMGIHIHFCEVQEDVKFMKENYGLRPGEFAESVGILGPKTLLVHSVWITPEDMQTIKPYHSTIVHNPTCNMKVASGFCPVPELLDTGINVSLGCDGGPSNNTYDMLREMRMAACIHKGKTLNPEVVPAEKVLEMATINGAKALGIDHMVGSVEIGKRADVILINCNKPHIVPNLNPVSTVVYSACGQDVDYVFVDGQMVVQKGEILTMDEELILKTSREQMKKLADRVGVDIRPRWPIY
jgi:cytosine/adenosine deaminase-related metal-dependent hydrolase